ncbi:MAG TPA: nuclear transport factor 2 family protein [Acidimicrobiales bacterium]|nr:nuclear transport factor 2 family protein [Acidimicrobiales bacterium]
MTTLQTILDERDVTNAVVAYADALDSQNWQALRDLLADEVVMESDLRAIGPATLRAEEMVSRVRAQVTAFSVTLHYLSNFSIRVDADQATCRSYLYAPHVIPEESDNGRFVAHAIYTHSLKRTRAGWRIAGLRVSFKIRDGEPPLPRPGS